MLTMLMEELEKIGLHLNSAKTKILNTVQNVPHFLDVAGNFIQILQPGEVHKYLGRHLPGALSMRGPTEVKHRLQAAWYKFHQYRWQLTNPNVSVKLRLKLFDSVVSPCVLFGMGALPIHQYYQDQIDITQRKMLRRIVGWARLPNEEWAITMHRMNQRLANAVSQYLTKSWSNRIADAK